VGQIWPWLPAHQESYLRQPTVEPGNLSLRRERRLLGLRPVYVLRVGGAPLEDGSHHAVPRNGVVARITRGYAGYNLDIAGDAFDVRRVRGLKGRAVLERREQALAAMQYHGRQMDTWTELVYDDRSYRLQYKDDGSGGYVLRDGADRPVLEAQDGRIALLTALPLPLIAMVLARIIDESTVRQAVQERRKSSH